MHTFNGLKHLFSVLIALSIVSTTLISCSGVVSQGDNVAPTTAFYAEYYATKRPNPSDLTLLNRYAKSTNNTVKTEALVILGKYLLESGEISKSEKLLRTNYNSPNLSPSMQIYGQLWYYDLLIAQGKLDQAYAQTENINAFQDAITFDRVIHNYCLRERLYPFAQGYNPCYLVKLNEPTSIVNKLKTYIDTNNTSQIIIEIPENQIGSEMIYGLFATINTLNLSYQVQPTNNLRNNLKTRIILIPDEYRMIIYGNQYKFFSDRDKIITQALYQISLQGIDHLLIGVSDNYSQAANIAKTFFENQGVNVAVLNYNSPGMQQRFIRYRTALKDTPYVTLALGSSTEVSTFAPYARYNINDGDEQANYYITDLLPPTYLDRSNINYFIKSSIYTPLLGVNNKQYSSFAKGYKLFYHQEPTSLSLLGDDVVKFAQWYINGAPNDKIPNFFYSIEGADFSYAANTLGVYKIKSRNEIERILY